MSDLTPEQIEARIERLDDLVRVITARDFDATQFYMSIPARPDRDADCVISWAARYIRELEAQVKELEEMRDTIAFAINHMPMPDDTYAFLCKALEEQRIAALQGNK